MGCRETFNSESTKAATTTNEKPFLSNLRQTTCQISLLFLLNPSMSTQRNQRSAQETLHHNRRVFVPVLTHQVPMYLVVSLLKKITTLKILSVETLTFIMVDSLHLPAFRCFQISAVKIHKITLRLIQTSQSLLLAVNFLSSNLKCTILHYWHKNL